MPSLRQLKQLARIVAADLAPIRFRNVKNNTRHWKLKGHRDLGYCRSSGVITSAIEPFARLIHGTFPGQND